MTPVPLTELPEDQIAPLLVASEAEGFRFVRRVVSGGETGVNRFQGSGEALPGWVLDGRPVAMCGLMRDPYQSDETVGRLRSLYVLPDYRGRGIGAALTRRIVELARSSFDVVRLRAGSPPAAAFYEHLGFTATTGLQRCTHV